MMVGPARISLKLRCHVRHSLVDLRRRLTVEYILHHSVVAGHLVHAHTLALAHAVLAYVVAAHVAMDCWRRNEASRKDAVTTASGRPIFPRSLMVNRHSRSSQSHHWSS